MAIMVAGGLTFAIPSVIPQAAAESATDGALTVSATSFGGAQILEISIDDPSISSVSDTHAQPVVTIDGDAVQMIQASTGVWYAYVADNSASGYDPAATPPSLSANPLISGTGETDADYARSAGTLYALALADAPNPSGNSLLGGDTTAAWRAQLYDFDNDGETLTVSYKSDSVDVEYNDDLADDASITVKGELPRGATVHLSIADTRLNLDPTAKDTWVLNMADGVARLPATVGGTLGLYNVTLGYDHGVLELPEELVVDDEQPINRALSALGTPVMTGAGELRFVETDANSGVFVSFDTSNNSPITVSDTADINERLTVTYAGNDATVIVRDDAVNIFIRDDGDWAPGEQATVTLEAPNLNENSRDSESISETSALIPTIVIGDPLTIADFTAIVDEYVAEDEDGATHDPETPGATTNRTSTKGLAITTVTFNATDTTVFTNNTRTNGDSFADNPTDESKVYRLDAAITAPADDTNIDRTIPANIPLDEADDVTLFTMDDTSVGSAPFYYVFTNHDDVLVLKNGTAATDGSKSTVPFNQALASDTLPASLELALKEGESLAATDTIILDILFFGGNGDDINNAIYRLLAEETGDNTGSFEGTLEYIMLNQINIDAAGTYNDIETLSDELVLIIDDEYSGNDLQASYDDETASIEVFTHTGTITLDADSYATNGEVTVTLEDMDLHNDAESYTLDQDGTVRGANDAPLVVFEIDDTAWTDQDAEAGDACYGLGLEDAFTFEEESPGVFTATFDIPTEFCQNQERVSITGKSLSATYYDFRDETGLDTTWTDSATIQAATGTVTMDRNVYPVPGDDPVTVYIAVADTDFNTDSDVIDTIPASSVTVSITPVSASNAQELEDAISEPLQESSEDSGVFEAAVSIESDALGANTVIEQSYIISVTYMDTSDATGEEAEATDSAIFSIGTATISVDMEEYAIKQTAFITLVDHDSNLDSDTRETIALTEIAWEGSEDSTLADTAFDASPPFLRETEENSGIFQTEITIPETIGNSDVELGESVTLTYVDNSPAGSDRPGVNDRDVETSFSISRVGASLTLDKDIYSWRDRITVTVVAPDFNIDSLAVEAIDKDLVQVRSQLDEAEVSLTETGPNTGIFQGTVDLGGFQYTLASGVDATPTGDMLEVGNEDGISVTFTYDEDERDLVQSALIRWNVAEVSWSEPSYREGATATLRVVDPDRNLHADVPDSIEAIVYSDTYRGGIRVALTETDPSSGVFEGEVILDTLHSEGNRLQVTEGDIVTAAYDDRTLPPPDGEGDKLRVTGSTAVGSVVPPLERVDVSNLGIVDALGNAVDSVSVGQQVNIAADLASAQSRSQDYAYILQIQNDDGVTVHLSWAASSLAGFGTSNVSQSWTPTEAGAYTATIFVWESLSNPTALSPQTSLDINVV